MGRAVEAGILEEKIKEVVKAVASAAEGWEDLTVVSTHPSYGTFTLEDGDGQGYVVNIVAAVIR